MYELGRPQLRNQRTHNVLQATDNILSFLEGFYVSPVSETLQRRATAYKVLLFPPQPSSYAIILLWSHFTLVCCCLYFIGESQIHFPQQNYNSGMTLIFTVLTCAIPPITTADRTASSSLAYRMRLTCLCRRCYPSSRSLASFEYPKFKFFWAHAYSLGVLAFLSGTSPRLF